MLAKNLFLDAMHLFYPHHCCGCGTDLLGKADLLCIKCISRLPHTHFEKYPGNPIERLFHGRIAVKAAHSAFYFSKGQLVQRLIHQLKYNNNQAIGEWMGTFVGNTLLRSSRFSGTDYLVPLPMHPRKEFKRGYNQAVLICQGLAKAMNVPVLKNNIVRSHATETQTHKHRIERWENVYGSFAVNDPQQLAGRHILLVDDVLTTGATLEACAQTISRVAGTSISIVTLAVASK
jgi:ComF family protein